MISMRSLRHSKVCVKLVAPLQAFVVVINYQKFEMTDCSFLQKCECSFSLAAKRLQDKEQLRDFEKTKLQLESMLEFKNRIMDSQANLQRELQRARQETRDAIEAREAHAEEMSELAESMEMATLDKEMAEEKV